MSQLSSTVGAVAPVIAAAFLSLYFIIKSYKIYKRASTEGDTKTQVVIFGIYLIMLLNLNVVIWAFENMVVIFKFNFYHYSFVPLGENPIREIFQR